MKKQVSFLLFCAILSGSAFSSSPVEMPGYDFLNRLSLVDDKEEEIDLQGSLKTIRSATPVRAFLSSSDITLDFLTSWGNITINITGGYGTSVYQATVEAIENEEFFIDITGWGNGNYTIYLTAEDGSYLYGNFDITD